MFMASLFRVGTDLSQVSRIAAGGGPARHRGIAAQAQRVEVRLMAGLRVEQSVFMASFVIILYSIYIQVVFINIHIQYLHIYTTDST